MPTRPKSRKARKPAAKANDLGALLLGISSSSPAPIADEPRSTSVRAKRHDWAALCAHIVSDSAKVSDGPVIIDWDELYVHAIERALVGRRPDELLALLDGRRWLHPILLPLIADVIRSQKDGARGAGKRLTQRQDAVIRSFVNKMGPRAVLQYFADLYKVSKEVIRESLARTKTKGK